MVEKRRKTGEREGDYFRACRIAARPVNTVPIAVIITATSLGFSGL
jgi:hypothetical protein